MRRLYSTFAGGWPGIGLLLMRVVAGLVLLVHSIPLLWRDPPMHTTMICASLATSGILLIPGLWTPVAGTLVVLITAGLAVTHAGDVLSSVLLATIAGALAMLGPGLWSVDARLFGWKRVEAPPRNPNPNLR